MVLVLITLGVSSVVGVAMLQMTNSQRRAQEQMYLRSSALAIRQNIVGTIGNGRAWSKTRSMNSVMSCGSAPSRLPAYCKKSVTGSQAYAKVGIYDSSGRRIVDSTGPAAGFTSSGEPCNEYSAAGNDRCPFKVTVNWRAECTAGTCSAGAFSASEYVSISFTYSPDPRGPNNFPFNPSNYGLVDQNRLFLSPANDSYSLGCSDHDAIFIGFGQTTGGITADPQGCVRYAALLGPMGDRGPQGAAGPRGPQGPRGPMGPQGPSVVCP